MRRWLIRFLFYPTLWFNRLMCFLGVWAPWHEVDEFVLIGNLPTRALLKTMSVKGVKLIVNLCAEFKGLEVDMSRLGLGQVRLATLDFHPPSAEDVSSGLERVFDTIRNQGKVYVHCKAGRGRSATFVICYLMARYQLTAGEAEKRLRSIRPHIDRNLEKRAVVQELEKRIVSQFAPRTPDHKPES